MMNHHFSKQRNYRSRGRQRYQAPKPNKTELYTNKAQPSTPEHVYEIMHKFSDFGFVERLESNISHHGYTTPTPIQDQAIPKVMAGHDVVGIANTGTGKTAAFLLPLINKTLQDQRTRVLIMCPTRELAVQIADELKAFSQATDIRSVLCIGGMSMFNQVGILKRQPQFVIGTPGRLQDLIERRALDMRQFSHVVLDEVDRMVDIGFLKDIRYLLSLLPSNRQSLFFSATITGDVTSIIAQFLHNPVTISVKTRETAALIDQDVIKVSDPNQKLETLIGLLGQAEFEKVIVFGRTKWGVEKLARNLDNRGFRAAAIHGNKSQSQRQAALQRFKNHQLQVLVATDVAARGLDIPNVSHVINFDEPASYEDYVHRIGRTGRADQRGKALTFVS